jgi:hypothetical protein
VCQCARVTGDFDRTAETKAVKRITRSSRVLSSGFAGPLTGREGREVKKNAHKCQRSPKMDPDA